jgi:arylsulfatase A-like enzyme
MRILYLDVDTLRPDHLGCYGYARNTSPNIDRIAEQGIRFDRCYASDTPCLPSRTALFTGQFGIRNGVVSHGGTRAELFGEGVSRGFFSELTTRSLPGRLRRAGLRTTSISTFGERHSAFHWYAGWQEVHNVGKFGMESAHEVSPIAIDWLRRNGQADDWFLHVHFWDPHTPYRAPAEYGDPFQSDPLPAWLTEEVRARHWKLPGPHSAQETIGFESPSDLEERFPRQPRQIDSPAAVRAMFDGYDTGVRYADEHIGRILDTLSELGVLDETAIVISSDHGETLGELSIYGDHHTADECVSRVPMILRWPGLAGGRVDRSLHYQFDVGATLIDLLGAPVPTGWDGRSFADALREEREEGRETLVLSHGAWTCQRSVRFDDWICIRTYHDGYHAFPEIMLFDLATDPHEEVNLASQRPEVAADALSRLDAWHAERMRGHPTGTDPMWTVMQEGGPWHIRGHLEFYLERLRSTGRASWAEHIEQAHGIRASGP